MVTAEGGAVASLVDVLGSGPVEQTVVFRHRQTKPMDPVTGQGDSHVQLALCVHRAVVDVDVELGLVKVVELAAVQDVGRILHRTALEGQMHGGTAQGLGLAVMEEMVLVDGKVLNASFTDYLIPTILDMPPMRIEILEYADPHAPYGLRGAGEPPTLSSTPAIVAAIRAATGRQVLRVPVRPEHLTGTEPGPVPSAGAGAGAGCRCGAMPRRPRAVRAPTRDHDRDHEAKLGSWPEKAS